MRTMSMAIIAINVFSAQLLAQNGNGAPNGSHYNLNILGKDHCAGDDLKGSNRHTIQVLLHFSDATTTGQLFSTLDKRNKIFLKEGDFQVLDGNACDGDGAVFQLPADPFTCPPEDPECLNSDPTFQNYTVWVRELGKPGGTAEMRTCAVDAGPDGIAGTADDEIACSTENVVLVRTTGKSSFRDVTKQLTTLVVDIDGDGDLERVSIFDGRLFSFFWDFDNNGLRLVQLRFYPLPD